MFNPLISTHAPAGGATLPPSSGRTQPRISTHAPAGGATRSARTLLPKSENFYSRPCGRGDPAQLLAGKAQRKFLLTPLREGRPPPFIRRQRASVISTHAPAGGATFSTRRRRRSLRYFYSRPCGRGDLRLVALGRDGVISTHAPAGGATCRVCHEASGLQCISTHAPAGGATSPAFFYSRAYVFLLTPLREGRQQFSTSPS